MLHTLTPEVVDIGGERGDFSRNRSRGKTRELCRDARVLREGEAMLLQVKYLRIWPICRGTVGEEGEQWKAWTEKRGPG